MPEYSITDRLKHAWNAFTSRDPTIPITGPAIYGGFSYRPDRIRFSRGTERSIVNSVYNRIAIDIAAIEIDHVRVDEEGRYVEDMSKSGLHNILTLEANIDQTSRSFIQDLVMSMLEEGVVCVVPVDTSVNPKATDSFNVLTVRTGRIVQWFPKHVKIDVYNDITGRHEEILMPKKAVAIIENPLYSVMNEPNSTLQRIIRKLNLLDVVDEQSSSGKMDLIIQLPYVIKREAQKQQAENRRKDIEMQLTNSKYGIAYTDGTERITQLNRPVENNLLKQVEYLMNLFFGQLGITEEVLKGTADERTMKNYYNRTLEPILKEISLEFMRKFITKNARTRGEAIRFYRSPFGLITAAELADVADKFATNEIMASNEIRQEIGLKPSKDPKADELRNSHLYPEEAGYDEPEVVEEPEEALDEIPISDVMS